MLWDQFRLRRSWWMEFEFFSACAAVGWSAIAFGAGADIADRPSLMSLDVLSNGQWAALVGTLGSVQLACVLVNVRWGRWLIAMPLLLFWCAIVVAVLRETCLHGAQLPLGLALYGPTAACTFLVVARLPREFPPRAR